MFKSFSFWPLGIRSILSPDLVTFVHFEEKLDRCMALLNLVSCHITVPSCVLIVKCPSQVHVFLTCSSSVFVVLFWGRFRILWNWALEEDMDLKGCACSDSGLLSPIESSLFSFLPQSIPTSTFCLFSAHCI